ncbi:NAD(P)H-binding protein [Brevibacillus laterosporus]|uniref:NAD-dependent epimerase/dehydratase family protein n=1 Tax=Brevibacillus laterosporus TaxID=1465 RepID=UPI0018CDAD64|nr:NAD-dependent epimerase/dehydratase family protein [Brevibacillus laterosporus]MBG9773878.1 oxidoreductase [Brevibacillus laterosporus]MBG9800385.1 oxidoreductase [Brevibacillus laterosporus]MCR8938138.1 NAD(P)H-binding protein [Brevibacillus laterosporus]MCZ0840778.1 NAD(P)H-binding protein [Brevibacillus laterosporus]MCZ0845899.1 NAD(P)H-binding protein [Brevibacillus laterosporus]
MLQKKTALLAGASGLVGGHLLSFLLEASEYERIYVVVRKALPIDHPKLEQAVLSFENLDQYGSLFSCTHIYCCLGSTRKKAKSKEQFQRVDYEYPLTMARLAKQQGAEKFLLVSALGANVNSLFFYNQLKGRMERDITHLQLPTTLIFRPSLLLGNRHEYRFAEHWAGKLVPFLSPLLIGPLATYRAIPAEEVAYSMYQAAQQSIVGNHVYKSSLIHDIAQSRFPKS